IRNRDDHGAIDRGPVDAVRECFVAEQLAASQTGVGSKSPAAALVAIETGGDVGVKAQSCQVEEEPSVEFTGVDAPWRSAKRLIDCQFGPPADRQLTRQPVARSGWHDPERGRAKH